MADYCEGAGCYCGRGRNENMAKPDVTVPADVETEEKDPNRYEWYSFNDLGTYRLARRRLGTVDLETVAEFFSKEALDQVAVELNR